MNFGWFFGHCFCCYHGSRSCLASVPVLLYQGSIALAAGLLQPFLSPAVLNELTAVGGILIIAIAVNLLELKKLKLPIFAGLLYCAAVVNCFVPTCRI